MRKKLLLADDSITIQKVVELTFPSDEFEVVTAGNGRLAVDKALAFVPDIVLCDVIMPQLDGYQVCEALRASDQLKNVPILLLNGAFEPYDAERAKAVGALGNVSKPFDPPALVARVKEILAEHSTAAISRPAAVEAVESLTRPPLEVVTTGETEFPATTVPHPYDDSETHPVSTVEVPMGVRELAARSLSLDAPVFASPEAAPEVLTDEEPASFSETLHGPLDDEVPGAVTQAPVEEIEAIEEIEPVAVTGEFDAPAIPAPPVAEAAPEPMEFDEEPSVAEEIPGALAASADASPSVVEEFSGEHEFEPEEAAAAPEATPEPIVAATEPEAIPMPPPPPAPAPAPVAEAPTPLPAPPPAPEPEPIAAAPAPMPVPEPLPIPTPAPAPVEAAAVVAVAAAVSANGAASAPLPSAEVAVPVDMVQQIAQRVISQVSERVIREIAWDVIPGLAEKLIKAEMERIKARAESERD
jgi:CheY-like chemotaxis protein